MSSIHRDDRPALIALALILLAIVLVAFFETSARQPLNDQGGESGNRQVQESVESDLSHSVAGADDFNFWEDPFPQWAMAFLAAIATGTGILGVIWIKQTLEASRDTAKAARDANKTARDALEADQRPWVSLDDFQVTRVRVGGGKVQFLFQIKAINMGKSPARAVNFFCDALWPRELPGAGAEEALERYCQRCTRTISVGRNMVVFPSRSESLDTFGALDLTASEFEETIVPSKTPGTVGRAIRLRVLVCVTYNVDRYTGFVANIELRGGVPSDKGVRNIPVSNVRMLSIGHIATLA